MRTQSKKDRTGQRLILVLLLLAIAGIAIWACVPSSKNENFMLRSNALSLNDDHELLGEDGAEDAVAVADGALAGEGYNNTSLMNHGNSDFEMVCNETVTPSTQVYFNSPNVPSGIGMGEGIYVNQRRTPIGAIPY